MGLIQGEQQLSSSGSKQDMKKRRQSRSFLEELHRLLTF
jgi:hypothetical protein